MKASARPFVLACLLLASLFRADLNGAVLTFGIYTSDKPSTMYKKFTPILNHLKAHRNFSGRDISFKLRIYPSYESAIEALSSGACHFARFGPASYIIAKRKNPGIQLLAMEHSKNRKRFNGVFIARKGSAIHSIEDFEGKHFAFGNEFSTIGRYLSQAEMIKKGVFARDLKSYKYLGRHDKVALAVSNGLYDAGVVKENTFKKYAESKGLKKVAVFSNVTKPWIASSTLGKENLQLLKEALLSITAPDILSTLKQDGFLPATDAEYDFVRKGMALSETF